VKVRHVEHALLLTSDPLFSGQGLALWTVSVAARGVYGLRKAARVTVFEVTAQCSGTALGNIGQHSTLSSTEPIRGFEVPKVTSDDIRDACAIGPGGGRHGLPTAVG
jgi:hypothetical protein